MSGAELHDRPMATTAPPESPYAALIDELYREEVLEARAMSLEHKFLAGEELFHSACRVTMAGIRHQNPGFDDEACRRELRRRLELRERMELQDRLEAHA